jgi:hypothetical protein
MSEDTATAIIFHAIVIAVIEAPFALNEYNRSHERGRDNGSIYRLESANHYDTNIEIHL